MKRLFFIPALACVLTLSVCAQGNRNAEQALTLTSGAALIVYYTWSGNSAQIARELQSQTGCDLLEITLVTPYTSNYNEMLEVAKSEFQKIDNSGVYPAIKNAVSLKEYDTVFIVYPLWWSRMAAPMQTFLHNNRQDLAGKTIALICTSASSGIAGTIADAKRLCPNSVFPEALHIRAANIGSPNKSITDWLSKIGFKTGGSAKGGNMQITVGNRQLTATLVQNSSTQALLALLKEGPVTIQMHDYGNFEKVGGLGKTLPANDERITTKSGDLILYQGNALVIYYAPNTWTFTRLGKIDNVTPEELKAALGEGDVTVTLSIPD